MRTVPMPLNSCVINHFFLFKEFWNPRYLKKGALLTPGISWRCSITSSGRRSVPPTVHLDQVGNYSTSTGSLRYQYLIGSGLRLGYRTGTYLRGTGTVPVPHWFWSAWFGSALKPMKIHNIALKHLTPRIFFRYRQKTRSTITFDIQSQ